MKIFDTHAHLCSVSFDQDLERVLAKASAAGVANIVAVGENLADAEKNIQLAASYEQILPAAGLYPAILDMEQAAALQNFIRLHAKQLAAIGEVGLDFWAVQDKGAQELQRDIFAGFIDNISTPRPIKNGKANRSPANSPQIEIGIFFCLHAFTVISINFNTDG